MTELVIDLLSVESVWFTVLDYPMSYIEFVGTVLYLASVWLIARRSMLTWPVGIVSVLLFMSLFYQIRLYADAFEQVYYLGASMYGWWYWSRSRVDRRVIPVGFSPLAAILAWLLVTVVLSLGLALAMTRIHLWAPALFPDPASLPYLDSLTTVMSLVAMWLMVRRRTESWLYWIVVDVIGIWLYYAKSIHFVSLLYVVLLVMAIFGLMQWRSLAGAGFLRPAPSGARAR